MKQLKLGIDIGSTTIKIVILDENDLILHSKYERHLSKIDEKIKEVLEELNQLFPNDSFKVAVSGIAGMGIAKR